MTAFPLLNGDRLWADLHALADLTDGGLPYTRRSFTPLFDEGRAWLAKRFADAGLAVRTDTAGNLIGRLEGQDRTRGTIAVGSHSDTVPAGGRFDGIAGLLAGLEIVRAIQAGGVRPRHALEVIDFLAEEPSAYGLSCVGSRGMAGELTPAMLALQEPGGETLGAALRRAGGDPDRLATAHRRDFAAFLELHIEQGRVLETKEIDVGIVTAIAGIRRIEIVFDGRADHAGTTPMSLRQDALVAAAGTIGAVRALATKLAAEGDFVATVGAMTLEPNAANVVPGRVRLVVDARSTRHERTATFDAMLERESAAQAATAGVVRPIYAVLSDGQPAQCDPSLRAVLREAAARCGASAIDLASGAGHDAAFMSRLCPMAMLFVPSRDGRSHAPEEWTNREALVAGAKVLMSAVLAIDGDQRGARPPS